MGVRRGSIGNRWNQWFGPCKEIEHFLSLHQTQRAILCVLLFCSGAGFGQIRSLHGTVSDSVTRESLPFVTILINENGLLGTSSDLNGNYTIRTKEPITRLRVSYVGYRSRLIELSPDDTLTRLDLQLVPLHTELEDVVVFAGDNPANRIIRTAVNRRNENDPRQLSSYRYRTYEKFVVTGTVIPEQTRPTFSERLSPLLEENHLMILESVVDHTYLAPDNHEQTVIAQKVSGLQNPNFTLLISQFQTTDFYKPFINIATTDFVNPISPQSWEKYFFHVEDTLFDQHDTVFVISYRPWKGKNFESLKGMLEIHTSTYAIRRVTAEPSDTALATLFVKIEQGYQRIDSTRWFPEYLALDIGFKKFLIEGLRIAMQGKTYIRDVILNAPVLQKEFDGIAIDLGPQLSQPDDYWNRWRGDTLTVREQKTYRLWDSLGRKYRLDYRITQLSALQDGLLRLPYVSIQLFNCIKVNPPEQVRLGMGVETNRDFSKKLQLAAFTGYGLRDARWKYGGHVQWSFHEPKNIRLRMGLLVYYEERGGLHFFQQNYFGTGLGVRNYTISHFDLVYRREIDFTARVRKFLNLRISGFTAHKTALDQYRFTDRSGPEPVENNEFPFSGIQLAIRYSYRERIVESFEHFYWINGGYPVVWLQLTKGLPGMLGGAYNYTKIDCRISHTFPTRSLGIFSFVAEGGWVLGNLPATDLYAGRSSYRLFGLYAPLSFQTMRSGEFFNDRFIALFLKQDLLENVIRWGRFAPNLVLLTQAAWGGMRNPQAHQHVDFRSLEKGYFESGIVLNNLIRQRFFGVVRFGAGFGVFYRYGAYAFPQIAQNLTCKISFSYNFK